MGTVFTLAGANFKNSNLPNINPFIDVSSLAMGYSFSNRTLAEVVSKLTPLTYSVPLRGSAVLSDTIPKATSNNLGLDINEACIDTTVTPTTLLADGTTPMTFYVVAGRNGEALASGGAGSPYIGSILNWGNTFGNAAGLMVQFSSTGRFGVRYNNQDEGNIKVADNGLKPAIFVVTYDGISAWEMKNITTGVSAVATSAASDMKAVSAANPVQIGTKRTTDVTYMLPFNVYQVAVWNKKLSATEIAEQVARTRARLSSLQL